MGNSLGSSPLYYLLKMDSHSAVNSVFDKKQNKTKQNKNCFSRAELFAHSNDHKLVGAKPMAVFCNVKHGHCEPIAFANNKAEGKRRRANAIVSRSNFYCTIIHQNLSLARTVQFRRSTKLYFKIQVQLYSEAIVGEKKFFKTKKT